MRYRIRQTTTATYPEQAELAHHVLRIMPHTRPGTEVEEATITIEPAPVERHDDRDFFGNVSTSITIDEPHEHLRVELDALVTVEPAPRPDPLTTPVRRAIAEVSTTTTDLAPASPAHFIYPSRLIAVDRAIRDWAAASLEPERPVLDGARELCQRIHAGFTYDPESTDADTTPGEAFRARRGVCQDLSQVMIAALRSLAVPAAYVSGWLRTIPPKGRPRLQGADAMHAWVAVWCGDRDGWVALDPTNDVFAGEDHVTLAVGRDFADVSPIDGIVLSSGAAHIDTTVDVRPLG